MVGIVCNCSIFLARCNGSKFHKCNLRPSFALGVRADVQPKSSIPIGAQVEFGLKGFTIGVKAEIEKIFSISPKSLINAELYSLELTQG